MSDVTPDDLARTAAALGEADEATSHSSEPETFLGTYRTREDAERGVAEKDRYIEELKAREAEAREQAAQAQAMMQYAQQQPQQAPQAHQTFANGDPIWDLGYLRQLVNNGEIDEFAANALFAEQQARLHSERAMNEVMQQNQQYSSVMQQVTARTMVDEAKTLLGQDADRLMHENREAVAEAIRMDPDYFLDPKIGANRIKQAVMAAEYERQHGSQGQPRTPDGKFAPAVHVEGGSGAEPQPTAQQQADMMDPDDPRRAFNTTGKRDAFGVIPGWSGHYQT